MTVGSVGDIVEDTVVEDIVVENMVAGTEAWVAGTEAWVAGTEAWVADSAVVGTVDWQLLLEQLFGLPFQQLVDLQHRLWKSILGMEPERRFFLGCW